MKYLFIVQGEGRGHITQSIALSGILEDHGHEVESVFVGRSYRREVPAFYRLHFAGKLHGFRSPNFIRTRDKKGINVALSIIYNLLATPLFLIEILRMARSIRRSDAAAVVNFYDMTGSLAHAVAFSRKKMFVLSHHFFFESQGFTWPGGHRLMRFFLSLHSRLVALGAHSKIALSFTPGHVEGIPTTVVAPPLLRKKLRQLTPQRGGYYLVYLLNEGFLDEIYALASLHADTSWHIYTGCREHQVMHLPNVKMSGPSGDEFLDDLAGCRAVICTAGFETVCESAWLGKPVLLIPSKGHFEQLCNLVDARRAGFAHELTGSIDPATEGPLSQGNYEDFRNWVTSADEHFMTLLGG
ncbi:MAG TPA: glycosyltransferase family protein [Bacteroidales bacterium]|nr:glycosyltransferase family protein [Bacteroidales bacterium]